MNIRRAMAEQILAGNSTEPAIEVFLRDIDEFLGERERLQRSGVSIPPRQRFVRCSFSDAPWSWMKFYVGKCELAVGCDPEDVILAIEHVILTIEDRKVGIFSYKDHYLAAEALAYCCRGSVRAVKRIHAAILRARDRCRHLCSEGVP